MVVTASTSRMLCAGLGLLAVLALIMIAVQTPAAAQSVAGIDAETVAAAEVVVEGVVVSQDAVVVSGMPYRLHRIAVDQVLSGVLGIDEVLVATLGGSMPDGSFVIASHEPRLYQGSTVRLALTGAPQLASAGSGEVYVIEGGWRGLRTIDVGLGIASSSGADDYLLFPFAWASFEGGIDYRVNPRGSGRSWTATYDAVQRGAALWNDDDQSAIDLRFAGRTDTAAIARDGENTILFTSAVPFAQALIYGSPSTGIVEFDIHINGRDFALVDGPNPAGYDLQTIVAHEIGHGIGLNHLTPADAGHPFPPMAELMFFRVDQGDPPKLLGEGDKAAIALLYPHADGPTCEGRAVTVSIADGQVPTSGDDVILGTPFADTIDGLDGDDTICGLGGPDTIRGGSGDDVIDAGFGDDWVDGEDGDDTVRGGDGEDRLFGAPGRDVMDGGPGNDFMAGGNDGDEMDGGPGDDRMGGNGGNDTILGGQGDDRLFGGSQGDSILGGAGNDDMNGVGGPDTMLGGEGDDFIKGDRGVDTLFGDNGRDDVRGGDGADSLRGNAGPDRLAGGAGDDDLDGGLGFDSCFGDTGVDTAVACEAGSGIP